VFNPLMCINIILDIMLADPVMANSCNHR